MTPCNLILKCVLQSSLKQNSTVYTPAVYEGIEPSPSDRQSDILAIGPIDRKKNKFFVTITHHNQFYSVITFSSLG